ncbi:MAG: DUF5107 domain-containing protein, partial [Verrucomicrobiae bacterium]|nr:DUF5107 domain-containing protein [Verrucomicrobiae bacterium]
MKFTLVALVGLIFSLSASPFIRAEAEVRTVHRELPTYGFSDPDPVPNIGRIYPYHRFDGYASEPQARAWSFVELENDYIRVYITPEIGGKIWGAVEKSTGHEFIYFNHVVKFRHIAMRGPWTSGGIETNFGVIGHAPTCSTPVDYLTRENPDGSVSCWIGAIDLPSRTVWRLEINLQPDKSYFTTHALWYNPTYRESSYYHWMNAGVKADGNLEFAYPGTHYIGHDGSLHDWPRHSNGHDLSWYEQNDFGRAKSYHVLGEATGFFGGYWHADDFGFGRYARYDEKPGKKLWIWGLSRQGMIWEDLLTDTDGQYVEIQSGRLFNQEASDSIRTPFKHRSFSPGSADTWTEYWFPVLNTGGITQGSPQATVNLVSENDQLTIYLSANQQLRDTLVIEPEEGDTLSFNLDLEPTDFWERTFPFHGDPQRTGVRIGDAYIIPPGGRSGQSLSRPLELEGFDWSTVQGM